MTGRRDPTLTAVEAARRLADLLDTLDTLTPREGAPCAR